MRKIPRENETLIGNQKYRGFCMELLEKISEICEFNFTIHIVEDGYMGSYVNGKWNGIVGELVEKKADLAVAGLTISFQREHAIDFTIPFLNLGISILYKRPKKVKPDMFSFLAPLSTELWIYMLAAYLLVTFMLLVVGRFSPYEWNSPFPCNPDSEVKLNQFTLNNSWWLTTGSVMRQGSDVNPQSPSTRLITLVWAFFTLIIISSYTANLAAFLTVQRLQSPIENVEDLSKQTAIKYGSQKSGSTENFFKVSFSIYTMPFKFKLSKIERVKGNYLKK
jgi:glutamate receptor, ionotropic, invertebrate